MKAKALLLVFCIMLFASSCGRKTEFSGGLAALNPEQNAVSESPHPFLNDIVSSCADRVDYLDFEASSSERIYGVEFVVVHFASNVVASPDAPFAYEGIRSTFVDNGVGANYLVMRDGESICLLPEERCAWHAGRGAWGGEPKYENKMNLYSIGIELAAIGSKSDMSYYLHGYQYDRIPKENKGFTQAQYEALAELIYEICTRNEIPMTREHIIGHDEYNPLKSDPGELFDWDKLMKRLDEMQKEKSRPLRSAFSVLVKPFRGRKERILRC